MGIDTKLLMKLFGTETLEEVLRDKEAIKQRARPVKPKVKRVKLSGEECRALCQKIGLEYLEGYEKRVFQYTFTDETVDRYGDIVVASGGDFKNYMKDPNVLAFHNGRWFPVGKSLKVWYDEGATDVKGWVLLLDERVDDTGFSNTVYNFVSSGAMKQGSIGFLPKEDGVERPDDDERKAKKMPRFGVIFTSWELLEFSVTPVPANPNASMKDCSLFTREGVERSREEGLFDAEVLDAVADALAVEEVTEYPGIEEQPPEGYKKDIFSFYAETAAEGDGETRTRTGLSTSQPTKTIIYELKDDRWAVKETVDVVVQKSVQEPDPELKTLLTTLITKQILLIEQMTAAARAMFRVANELQTRTVEPSPSEGGKRQADGEELYDEEAQELESAFGKAVGS